MYYIQHITHTTHNANLYIVKMIYTEFFFFVDPHQCRLQKYPSKNPSHIIIKNNVHGIHQAVNGKSISIIQFSRFDMFFFYFIPYEYVSNISLSQRYFC